jgi:pyrroline-5-carboxylate reductase
MKICIIGGGNMGLTYADGFIRSGLIAKNQLLIVETNPEQQKVIKKRKYNLQAEINARVDDFDIIIIAVKPQQCDNVLTALSNILKNKKYILSIMAGITLSYLEKYLANHLLFRAMPNLPAKNGLGMTVFTTNASYTGEQLFVMHNLLNITGKTLYVDDEQKIDAATAISGSGPAYVFYFMQSMVEKAIDFGFSKSEAELLVKQTFLGSVQLYINSEYSCDEWIKKVSSKRGTTEAAFNYFNEKQLKNEIKTGIEKAFERAQELAKN